MSDITVSQLPTKTQLLDADMVVIDDGAQSYKMYYAQFKNLFRQAFNELFVNADGDTMTGALVMDGVKVVHRQGAQNYTVLDTRDIPGGGAVGYPDLTAGVSIASGYETTEPGWVYFYGEAANNYGTVSDIELFLDGVLVYKAAAVARDGRDGYLRFGAIVPVRAGVTVTSANTSSLIFYPTL